MTPTKKGWSNFRREFERGLNMEVTQPSTSVVMVLVELKEGHHDRERHKPVPRFTALKRR